MVGRKHFARLKEMYTSASSRLGGERVAISFGRAELNGTLDAVESDVVLNRMPHHRLLSDAASLAAGSLEKEHLITAEQFTMDVEDPDYEGPVVVTAEVVMAEPPRSVVQANLWSEEGRLVAEATGIFRPSENKLPSPSGASREGSEEDAPTLPPASFMPVYTSPYGVLCLN